MPKSPPKANAVVEKGKFMSSVKVGPKGQVVIPKEVRDLFGFGPGDTLLILGLGLFAFVFDTAGGVLFAKLLNLFRKNKITPMVGAAGILLCVGSAGVVNQAAQGG